MMTFTYKTSTLKFLLFGLLFEFLPVFKTYSQCTQEQAIQLAENYIIENGYTTLPADKSKFSYEYRDEYDSIINEIWVEETLNLRYNAFHQKAFCINEYEDQWQVGFLFKKVDLDKLDSIQRKTDLPGMVVVVYKNGKKVRLGTNISWFSKFEKL